MQIFADMHMHSTCSDGTDSPLALLEIAEKNGLKGISITDHDTLEAYSLLGNYQGPVEILPGVEFSCIHQGHPVHILAYGVKPKCPYLEPLCQRHQARRENRLRLMLEKLASLGIDLSWEEVIEKASEKKTSIGRPHIAQCLVQKGVVNSIKEAFHRYLGQGKQAFVQGEIIGVQETLDLIKQAKALATIAHPYLVQKKRVLDDLFSMDFDAIEVHYAHIPELKKKRFIALAKEKKWLVTGGSDYHGMVKEDLSMGASGVTQEAFGKIKERICEL